MAPILIAGVHAAGKSSIGRELSRVTGLALFEYADFMLPVIGTEDRARILSIPFEQRAPIYEAADHEISRTLDSKRQTKLALLTIHLSLYLNGKIETFPDSHYLTLRPAGLLQIECSPQVVFSRRQKDRARFRALDSIAEIRHQQAQNRTIATHVSRLCSISMLTINNTRKSRELNSAIDWIRTLAR